MRPTREALAALQLRAAQEQADLAPQRMKALEDAALLRGLQIQDEQRKAALAGITPQVVDVLGVDRSGGYFEGPTGKFKDEVLSRVEKVRNPDGTVSERKVPLNIVPGEEIGLRRSAATQKAELANARLQLDKDKVEQAGEIARMKLEAAQAKIDAAEATAEAKGYELIRGIDKKTRELVLTMVDKKTGKQISQNRVAGVYPTGEQGGMFDEPPKPGETSSIPAGNLQFLTPVSVENPPAQAKPNPYQSKLLGPYSPAKASTSASVPVKPAATALDINGIIKQADEAIANAQKNKAVADETYQNYGVGAF